MCTVSFVPNKDRIIISSNRDEHISRADAKEIDSIHLEDNTRLFFPKDEAKGGTWFATTDQGNVTVLLNGAFKKHIPQYPYSQSRGIVLLELLSTRDVKNNFENRSFKTIEPFTLIHYNTTELLELRWDGIAKYYRALSPDQSYIWSSSTLYNAKAREQKEKLFKDFIFKNPSAGQKEITDFHLQSSEDKENGFVINRCDGIQTRSFTQAIISASCVEVRHYTFSDKNLVNKTIPVISK